MASNNKEYRFGDDFNFVDSSNKFLKYLVIVLKLMGIAFIVAVVLYGLFAVLVNTDIESRLKRENKMYEKLYPSMQKQTKELDDAISMLQVKDDRIYHNVFHSSAPSVDPIGSLDFHFGADSIPETKIISYTRKKADPLAQKANRIEENFRRVLREVGREDFTLPPMQMPLKGLSYTQVGASKGERMNPIYKARIEHSGLDFITTQGEKVYAAMDGQIAKVDKSSKGYGNMVTVSHDGGYSTRYAHLSQISVKEGQRVKAGDVVGEVGMSGTAYAPHLHYEVLLNGVQLDPIGYIFASVDPEVYCNMLYMAVNTQQSMD